jgi:hypothetical protein
MLGFLSVGRGLEPAMRNLRLQFCEGLVFHTIHRYGELWCDAILRADELAKVTRGAKRKEKRVSIEGASARATISFPSELYKTLEGIAREKKVSLAWVVREAAEQYVADKWPLFKGKV